MKENIFVKCRGREESTRGKADGIDLLASTGEGAVNYVAH